MNKEEINEAIKLIKEPIIVNSVEYKYFNQENYKKLLRIYENCRWFIDNYEQVLQNIENLQQELHRKDNIIKIMENYLELIYDLGYDYDGCETTSDLMSLIDEIVRYASLGRVYNTTETIYVNGNEKYNILHEKIEDKNE